MIVFASNDINENVLKNLKKSDHQVDSFGIGTNLVTCQAQPALGMVYKLVQINGLAKIKLSDEREKTTLPGEKQILRVYTKDPQGKLKPELDLICLNDEYEELLKIYNFEEPGTCALPAYVPFGDNQPTIVYPIRVEALSILMYENGKQTFEI